MVSVSICDCYSNIVIRVMLHITEEIRVELSESVPGETKRTEYEFSPFSLDPVARIFRE